MTYSSVAGTAVLEGGKWKHLTSCDGPLPHFIFSFSYESTHPPSFIPNPTTYPSVTLTFRVDDSGKISRSGKSVCTASSIVTVKHQG